MDKPQQKGLVELTAHWTLAQPIVAAFISSMIPKFHDAEDVLQMVAVTLAKKFNEYDRDKPFVAWSLGIAKYEVLNYRRKNAHDRHFFDIELINQIAETYQAESPKLNNIRKALSFCIKQLQGRARLLLDLRYIREFKPERIAQQLGMTTNAVFVALHRVRIAMRKCIDQNLAETEAGL
jgi:RNA polymerase sigma-70 factor (ECF subfamily)